MLKIFQMLKLKKINDQYQYNQLNTFLKAAALIYILSLNQAYAGAIHPLFLKKQINRVVLTPITLVKPVILTTSTSQTSEASQESAAALHKFKKNKEIKDLSVNTFQAQTQTQIQTRSMQDLKRAQALIDQENQTSESRSVLGSINSSMDASNISFKDVILKNRILAVVNNNMLTTNDAQNYIKSLKKQALQNQIAWHEPRENIENIVLPRLIIDKIQLQRARDIGLKINDTQMQNIIQNIAQKQGLTLEQMRDQFNQEGIDFGQYINETREGIILSQLQDREFGGSIQVSPAEIDAYLKKYMSYQNQNPVLTQVKLRHIVFRQDSGEPEALKKQLQNIQQKISTGRQSFETMALIYSQDSTAAKGGYIGNLFPEEMPVGLEQDIQNLPISQVSGVLKSDYGYHIVQVLDRQKVVVPPSQQLKLVESILIEKKTEAAYQNWLKKLKKAAYIEYKNQ